MLSLNGRVIITGQRDEGLYSLDIQVLALDVPAMTCTSHQDKTLQIWHEGFAHQGKQYVKKFLIDRDINYVKDNELCESCIKWKKHRLSFAARNVAVEKPGDLINADL